MSTASAKAYVQRLKTDKAFAKRINDCKTAEARFDLIKAQGFAFTKDEILAQKAELSAADLDRVAGGAPPNVCKKKGEVVSV